MPLANTPVSVADAGPVGIPVNRIGAAMLNAHRVGVFPQMHDADGLMPMASSDSIFFMGAP